MTIKQQGGVFGRNPAFNDVEAETIEVTDISLPDGGEASFGNSNDLKIYHDGSNSYVQESGVGSLLIYGSNMRLGNSDGSKLYFLANSGDKTDIYFDGAVKIRTQNTGAQIFGDLAFSNGNGIDFSATAGTGTSELFDDYEEGTWTVELYDAASAGNVSPTTATGYYTKIGRQVNLTFSLSNIDTTGMTSGNVLYFTLPFTAGFVSTGALVLESFTLSAGRTWVAPWINAADTRGRFRQSGSAVIAANLTVGSINSGGSDIERCTLTYFVG